MGLQDANLVFSAAQALTVSYISDNVVDTKALGTDFTGTSVRGDRAAGMPVAVNFLITTSFATITYCTFSVQHSDSVGSGYVDIVRTVDMASSRIVAGFSFKLWIPYFSDIYLKRYLATYYTITTTGTGAVSAWLTISG